MSDTLSDVFRANVIALMERRCMTRIALARRLGCTPDTVSKTLNNPRGVGVRLTTLERYARALNVAPAVLVTPRD